MSSSQSTPVAISVQESRAFPKFWKFAQSSSAPPGINVDIMSMESVT